MDTESSLAASSTDRSKEPVIRVSNLYKDFVVSHSSTASIKTLMLWKKDNNVKTLHVLRGVSFEAYAGECLGIVGRNGAGKSTLLSLMARIYKPTSGTAEVVGRLAPLLELGAGFHPDLTGLQNIYINATILGLRKKEIDERLTQIIDFAEMSNHVDAPVRTYSSGMAARLGFAIAIHVDAQVLLMDELLSVGDFAFRAKCEAKFIELKREGKTIVVVSHGSDDLRKMADRCIWLQYGQIAMEGPPEQVLKAYTEQSVNILNAPIQTDLSGVSPLIKH